MQGEMTEFEKLQTIEQQLFQVRDYLTNPVSSAIPGQQLFQVLKALDDRIAVVMIKRIFANPKNEGKSDHEKAAIAHKDVSEAVQLHLSESFILNKKRAGWCDLYCRKGRSCIKKRCNCTQIRVLTDCKLEPDD
jgi:hypothetical protein